MLVFSGVKGDELVFTAAERWHGEGVKGIRPPAVREEKSPAWDLRGVETDAVAMTDECAAAVSMFRTSDDDGEAPAKRGRGE